MFTNAGIDQWNIFCYVSIQAGKIEKPTLKITKNHANTL